MTKMLSSNPKVSVQDLKQFEQTYNVILPKQYADFLLTYNGGYPQKSYFKISEDEGSVNKFYGLGDMKSNVAHVFEVLEGEIPEGFMSIANDPGGNEILLGFNGEHHGRVYFWIHDLESANEMDSLFLLAGSFTGFFHSLYESE